ncbi:MAG: hypothetical protein L0G29_02625, partial [Pseudomonas sp.]|nr:hypothetical protein [Pseudomonas sp.]
MRVAVFFIFPRAKQPMWYNGFLDLSAWQLVAVTLLMTHVT